MAYHRAWQQRRRRSAAAMAAASWLAARLASAADIKRSRWRHRLSVIKASAAAAGENQRQHVDARSGKRGSRNGAGIVMLGGGEMAAAAP